MNAHIAVDDESAFSAVYDRLTWSGFWSPVGCRRAGGGSGAVVQQVELAGQVQAAHPGPQLLEGGALLVGAGDPDGQVVLDGRVRRGDPRQLQPRAVRVDVEAAAAMVLLGGQ